MQQLYKCYLSLLSLLLLASLNSQAQVKSEYAFQKMGIISKEHLEMTKYSQDTSAEAVVLYDVGSSYFNLSATQGLRLVFERHVKVKVLKKSGYDWGDVAIRLYRNSNSEREAVTSLKAFTYNMVDGKMVSAKLTKESIFEEKNTENMTTQKFTMPNVKEGSVIEYSYRIESPFYHYFQDWTFQRTIPTLWSEYSAEIPEYFDYKKVTQGYEPLVINEAKPVNINWPGSSLMPSGTKFHWAMKDVPAMKKEPYMNSVNNYVSKIEFELGRFQVPGIVYETYNNSWGKVSGNLLASERFGTQINRTAFVKETITPLIAGIVLHSYLINRIGSII